MLRAYHRTFEPEDYDPALKEWSLENLPIIPSEFKYKVSESKRLYFNTIKKFILDPSISMVIHAGDPGREGEAIPTSVLKLIGNKKTVKRLWTASLTKDSVRKAFANLRDIKDTMPYYREAIARQQADWIMGLSANGCLTLLLSRKVNVYSY